MINKGRFLWSPKGEHVVAALYVHLFRGHNEEVLEQHQAF